MPKQQQTEAEAFVEKCREVERLKESNRELLAALRDLVEQFVNYADSDDADLPDVSEAQIAIEKAELAQ